ncbi:lasso peptide biosynthesis PqqD family chaperone [Niallia oryzisoli]|uniref:Lasso peptide biosynthesis PqqD family chaperone n=1 Tax=Niallia oryzisoli TaxID=1737571 RepID=A0ABZ2CB06_9BACI
MIKSKSLSLQQSVRQVKGNIVSNMGEEKVMLSVESGKYYNFGDVGGNIWDLMAESITINQLVISLINIYDVEKAECEQQVFSFLEQLLEEKLIELV